MTFSAIERIYGNNVRNGKKTLDEVPEKIRENVKAYVLSVDPTFFDVEEPVEEETPVEDPAQTEAESDTPSAPTTGGGSEGATEETPVAVMSLEEKYNNANAGDTIVLEQDERLTSALVVEKDITIDLNGHNIYSTETAIKAKANLTIIGEGRVEAGSGGNYVAVYAYTDSNVVINGGEYHVGEDAEGSGNTCIYVNGKGNVEINGGKFSTAKDYNGLYYVLNKNNNATGNIVVKGGTFVNYNPAGGDDALGGTFVADGYESIDNGDGTYTVSKIEE